MANRNYWKCYFKCDSNRILHRFPHPDNDTERFHSWVKVLDPLTQKQAPIYIHNNLKLCDEHFESFYLTHNKKLTRNAVPTLNIKPISNDHKDLHIAKKIYKEGSGNDTYGLNKKFVTKQKKFDVEDIFSESPKEFSWNQPESVVDISEDEDDCEAEYLDDDFSYCSDDDQTVCDPQENITDFSNFQCNFCTRNIVGMRYVCLHCNDMDICGACEAKGIHDHHYVLRVPKLRPHAEVCSVLTRIRQQLVVIIDPISNSNAVESFESDVKEESEEMPNQMIESNKEEHNRNSADALQSLIYNMVEDEILPNQSSDVNCDMNNVKEDSLPTRVGKNFKLTFNSKDVSKKEPNKLKTAQKCSVPNGLRKTQNNHILTSNKRNVQVTKKINVIESITLPQMTEASISREIDLKALNEQQTKTVYNVRKVIKKSDYLRFIKLKSHLKHPG